MIIILDWSRNISFILFLFFFVCMSSIFMYWAYMGLRATELRNIYFSACQIVFLQSALLQKFSLQNLFNFIHYFKNTKMMCITCRLFSMHQINILYMGWDPHDGYKIADSFCVSFYDLRLTKYLLVLYPNFLFEWLGPLCTTYTQIHLFTAAK